MTLFRTRREVRELRQLVEVMNVNMKNFSRTYNGSVRLVDEALKSMDENSALRRQQEGSTARPKDFTFTLTPEYGENWEEHESKLNKKGTK